jgi:hypothetical protein
MTSDGSEIVNFELDRLWKAVVVTRSEASQHLPGRTEDNKKNFSADSLSLGQIL